VRKNEVTKKMEKVTEWEVTGKVKMKWVRELHLKVDFELPYEISLIFENR